MRDLVRAANILEALVFYLKLLSERNNERGMKNQENKFSNDFFPLKNRGTVQLDSGTRLNERK